MKTIVFLLEELSAKIMLNAILPKLLPEDVDYKCISFDGKQDLEKQLALKIRAWLAPNTCFLIMRDQDSENCLHVKERLAGIVAQTGKARFCVIRIACHELESFFLGDLAAVEQGLSLDRLVKKQNSKKFRNPDALANPSEEIKKLNHGAYPKIKGSEMISPHLKLDGSNRSTSFNQLLKGICKAINTLEDNKSLM